MTVTEGLLGLKHLFGFLEELIFGKLLDRFTRQIYQRCVLTNVVPTFGRDKYVNPIILELQQKSTNPGRGCFKCCCKFSLFPFPASADTGDCQAHELRLKL